jgi:hypothetical protein
MNVYLQSMNDPRIKEMLTLSGQVGYNPPHGLISLLMGLATRTFPHPLARSRERGKGQALLLPGERDVTRDTPRQPAFDRARIDGRSAIVTPAFGSLTDKVPRFRWGDTVVVIALILLGLALRLRGLVVPGRDLWIDETFSVWLANLPVAKAVATIAAVDQHPPLYAVVLHGWLIFGDDPWWARLSSVLAGVAAIPIAARLGSVTGGRRTGLIAGALVAVSPVLVRYSQEVRMYALVVALAFLSTLFLSTALDRPSLHRWLAFGIVTLAMIYTHNITLFLLPAQALFVLGRSWRARAVLRAYVVTMAGVGALWLPWAPILVHQAAGVIDRFWIGAPSVGDVRDTFLDLLLAFPPPTVTLASVVVPLGKLGSLLLIPFAALVVVGVVASWRRNSLLYLSSVIVPVGLALGLSLLRPIFQERVILFVTMGLLMLVASGIAAIRFAPASAVVLIVVVGLNLASVENYNLTFRKERWQDAASYVARNAKPDDLIFFNATWAQLPFDYYYQRHGGPTLVEHGLPVDLFDRGVLEPPMLESDIPTIAAETDGRRDVWVLLSHDWYNDPGGLIRPSVRALFPKEQVSDFGQIVVIHYAR